MASYTFVRTLEFEQFATYSRRLSVYTAHIDTRVHGGLVVYVLEEAASKAKEKTGFELVQPKRNEIDALRNLPLEFGAWCLASIGYGWRERDGEGDRRLASKMLARIYQSVQRFTVNGLIPVREDVRLRNV